MKVIVKFIILLNRKTLIPLTVRGKRFYSTKQVFYKKGRGNWKSSIKNEDSNVHDLECEHMAKVFKTYKLKAEVLKKNCSTNNTVSAPRQNELNIQMLSENLYKQIFKEQRKERAADSNLIKKSVNDLKQHGLWKDTINFLEDVCLDLPVLKGKNIEEHFWAIGKEQSESYKNLVLDFIKNKLPKKPETWLCQKGWTKYESGKEPVQVLYPDDKVLVFDVEVCVKLGELPTLATAVSDKAWYGWVSSNLSEEIYAPPAQFYDTNYLVPFEGKDKSAPRVIVGHNVSYDRARLKEQYSLESSALRFIDTMSLHISIGGITKEQKNQLKRNIDEDGFESWKAYSCLSSLKDVYTLYCKKELAKEKRSVFLEGTLIDIRNDFQSLMEYCANDVSATYEVLQVLFPVFLERFPHPVTLAGMLEMSLPFFTVNNNWKKFLLEADQTYEDLRNEMSLELSKKSDQACTLLHDEKYKEDLWMWDEDWSTQKLKLTKKKIKTKAKSAENENDEEDLKDKNLDAKFQYLFDLEEILPKTKPFLPGYPFWYRKLCEKSDSNVQLTTGMQVTPKLLHLTWENFPLFHTKEFGWGILVADIYAKNVETALPFDKLRQLTLKNCNIEFDEALLSNKNTENNSKKLLPPPYYTGTGIWCKHMIDNCCYFYKLPHKDGASKNVGNPLSKDFTQIFSSCILAGSDHTARKVVDLGTKLTYWRNNRERISNQMVVWLNKKEASSFNTDEDSPIGVILPKVVVCGTLTRRALEATWLTASKATENRIGSELRSLIQAPPGYHIVGADVDSQELWIASLIGDSNAAKVHGSTPLGWMTLSGTRASGTDMHSMTAKAVGISRTHAKIINYARIYGAGVKFAQKLLQQFNPSMSEESALSKARKMYALTKGVRTYKVKASVQEDFRRKFGSLRICDIYSALQMAKIFGKKLEDVFEKAEWIEGTESAMFNQLEKIAHSLSPKTPFLSCSLSRALEPQFEGDSFNLNTRINWIVQSGAVDFLHLMLVCMRWLTNGQARYCFSFHDEVRYLIPSEKRYSGALAVHITNLLVRAFCAHRLGIYDLPQSVAFFSSVEVDKILRKEANDDCVTPSNPHGMKKGYGIPAGESLNIYETIKKSGGNLTAFSKNNQVRFNHFRIIILFQLSISKSFKFTFEIILFFCCLY